LVPATPELDRELSIFVKFAVLVVQIVVKSPVILVEPFVLFTVLPREMLVLATMLSARRERMPAMPRFVLRIELLVALFMLGVQFIMSVFMLGVELPVLCAMIVMSECDRRSDQQPSKR